jgi:MFS family permease
MNALYASLIPHAIAVALSPMPIAALIFLLLSNKPKENSLGFLAGWFVALVVNVFIFAFLFGASGVPQGGDPLGVRIFHFVLGVILIIFAFNEWKKRPKKGQKPTVPKWMKEITGFTPTKSFLIATALVTINAKNTVLDVAVGDLINNKAENIESGIVAIFVFAFIASLSILIPVVAFLLFGDRLKKTLNSLNGFFIKKSNMILFILFLILGIGIVSKAF